MTVRRLIICVIAVVAVCIVNVYHHAQVVRYGYRLSEVQRENQRLRVSIADLQGRVTMLAEPARLRRENERMQLSLVDPGDWRRVDRAVVLAEHSEGGRGELFTR